MSGTLWTTHLPGMSSPWSSHVAVKKQFLNLMESRIISLMNSLLFCTTFSSCSLIEFFSFYYSQKLKGIPLLPLFRSRGQGSIALYLWLPRSVSCSREWCEGVLSICQSTFPGYLWTNMFSVGDLHLWTDLEKFRNSVRIFIDGSVDPGCDLSGSAFFVPSLINRFDVRL